MHFTFPKALQSSTTTSDRHSWRPALKFHLALISTLTNQVQNFSAVYVPEIINLVLAALTVTEQCARITHYACPQAATPYE